jgi:glucose-6-phosphate 1-dehydrogenase
MPAPWGDNPGRSQNKLTIRLQPDEGVDIQVLNKVPGALCARCFTASLLKICHNAHCFLPLLRDQLIFLPQG